MGKHKMKSEKLLVITTLMLLTSAVFAGGVEPVPVQVIVNEDMSGTASGDMRSARVANNDIDIIGCGIKTFADGTYFGFCQALVMMAAKWG